MGIRGFFSFPEFEDTEQTRIARLLHTALFLAFSIFTILWIIDISLFPEHALRWGLLLAANVVLFPVLVALNRRGWPRVAAVLMLGSLWLLINAHALIFGGIYSPGITASYIVVVLLAGLIFGEKVGTFVGIFCAISLFGFVVLQEMDYISKFPAAHSPLAAWIAQVLALSLVISIQFIAARSINNALNQARLDLADRKRSDLALKKSEKRYRSLVSATAQIVWVTNNAGEVLGDVESWCQFTGQKPEDVLGQGWLNAVHSDDRERTAQIWAEAVASYSAYETEYRLRRADGAWRSLVARGVPVPEEDGLIREWIGACYDITERKAAEAEIRSFNELLEHIASVTANTVGEEYFKMLVRHLAESLKMRYAFVGQLAENHQTARTLALWDTNRFLENFEFEVAGTPCENVIGKTLQYYPTNVQKLFPADSLLVQMNADSYCGTPIFGRNGEPLGVLVVLGEKPTPNPGSRLQSILRIFAARAGMELERMRLDADLRKSEELFEKAFQCSPVVLTILSAENMRFLVVNETFTEVTGYTREEVTGRPLAETKFVSDPRRLDDFCHLIQDQGRVHNFEYEFRRKDGELRMGLSSAEVVEISGVPRILAISKDITDSKRVEMILRQSRDDLEKLVQQRTEQLRVSNKELEAFTSTVSHDLQAPIRAINGFARAIKEDYDERLDDEGREFLNRIVQASERMSNLLTDLLAYSRIGRQKIALRPVPLKEVINEVASDFEFQLREIGGQMHVSNLPAVMGEKTLIAQTFANLFQNAIKYRKVEVPLLIDITMRPIDNDVVICVTDNGPGIPTEFHQKIFEPFERLQGGIGSEGSGLGLANVKKSIETMGGAVWVESEPGHGSTFCVELHPARI